jgi:hypothetical protein
MFVGAQKKLPFRCRHRAVGQRAVQWIDADQFKFRLGAEDDRFAGLIGDENFVSSQQHRAPRFLFGAPAAHALREFYFAGF